MEPVPSEPARTERDQTWLTPGRFSLGLALLIAASYPTVLFGARTFVIRDFGMFGYPLAWFHRESFWRGELPFWDPLNSCGIPFLAQWNTLTLYPFSLIYLLFPLSWSLSFFCLVHMFWGGLGMYFWAWRSTNHRLAAALAGIIYAFNGLTLNTLMWPNIIAALGWLPWVVWLGQRAWREGGKRLVPAIVAGAMQMLTGGPEPILLTWVLLFCLACADILQNRALRLKIPLRVISIGLLVALVCAAQLLPFLDLLLHSQRDSGFSSASHNWIIPYWGWANFLVPLFRTSPTAQNVYFPNGQYWTSSYYAGIVTLLLCAVAVWRVRDKSVWLLAGVILAALILATGDTTFIYPVLKRFVPGLGFIRYPVKFTILILAVAPVLAAFGVKTLASDIRPARRFELTCALFILLVIGIVIVWDWNTTEHDDIWRATRQNAFLRAGFFGVICIAGVALLKSQGKLRSLLTGLFLILVWLDFFTHVPNQNPTARRYVYDPGLAAAQLNLSLSPFGGGASVSASRNIRSRVMLAPAALETLRFHPMPSLEDTFLRNRLAIRPDCNMLDWIPQIDGFFSMTPREAAIATQLPYNHADQDFSPLLDLMSVSHATGPGNSLDWSPRPTFMPLVTAGQEPVFAADDTALKALSKTNINFRQKVFLPADAQNALSAINPTGAKILSTDFANERVSIQADATAPSVVLVSQTYYPAWKAYVDGHATKLWRANYAFQAVAIPAGHHEILLRYEDRTFYFGLVVSAVGILACFSVWLKSRRPVGTD